MIHAQHLGMDFGSVMALDDASFAVNQGEVLGLLGPNGAGKSTIMKILTTYLRPTRGQACICGFDAEKNPIQVRKKIGYLPENLPLYPEMEVGEYLCFVAQARGLYGPLLKKRLEWVLCATDLVPMFHRPVTQLSKGYRQRTGLAQALIHDPEVIILDEPTTGLDPHQILEIRALIKTLAKSKTVLFSTHILHEVEAIADRVVIINQGRIRAQGSFNELSAMAGVQPLARIQVKALATELCHVVESLGAQITTCAEDAHGWQNLYFTAEHSDQVFAGITLACAEKNWPLRELYRSAPSLEEVFLALTRAEQAKQTERREDCA